METTKKKVMLIDLEDGRRTSRIQLLQHAGYDVTLRPTYLDADRLSDEGSFDLIILALHLRPDEAVPYSERLSKNNPNLPILLLTDYGVFVPRGTLNKSVEAGDPVALLKEVAAMLAGSAHIREMTADLISGD